jgi:hypothetical protein
MQHSQTKYSPLISLIDETFSEEYTSTYHLSLEVATNSIAFAILDVNRNKYIFLETYIFQKTTGPEGLAAAISDLVDQRSLLKKSFKSVSVGFFTPKFTLIPAALFDENLTAKYLDFNAPLAESEVVVSDAIKNFESQCVYAINSKLLQVIQELYPKSIILHTFTSLLETLSSTFKNVAGKNVIIHLQQTHFELMVIEEKKLIFANLFAYQSSEDFLYFTLFVCEQLKLNPENLELLLLGEVEKNSAIYSILSKYVRNVKFGKRSELFEYSYAFDSIPSHFYFNLFSQALCV